MGCIGIQYIYGLLHVPFIPHIMVPRTLLLNLMRSSSLTKICGVGTCWSPSCAIIRIHEEGASLSEDGDTSCVFAPQVRLAGNRSRAHGDNRGCGAIKRHHFEEVVFVTNCREQREGTRRGIYSLT